MNKSTEFGDNLLTISKSKKAPVNKSFYLQQWYFKSIVI